MLIKEFLDDTVDDINEKDFIDLKNQINDLTKFKEAAQEKIKTDVNYEDVNKLTTELTNLGIKYESYNNFYDNIVKYFKSDNAWDARSGEIIIDSEDSISPKIQKLFNKLTSNKNQVSINNMEQESGRFKGNKLNSASLVYLLLNEYYNFGFTLGNISISPDQAYELQRNKFYQDEESFDRGYNS